MIHSSVQTSSVVNELVLLMGSKATVTPSMVATVSAFIWPLMWPQDKTQPSSAILLPSHHRSPPSPPLLHLLKTLIVFHSSEQSEPPRQVGRCFIQSSTNVLIHIRHMSHPSFWRLNLTNSSFEDAKLSFHMKWHHCETLVPSSNCEMFYGLMFLALHFELLLVTPELK